MKIDGNNHVNNTQSVYNSSIFQTDVKKTATFVDVCLGIIANTNECYVHAMAMDMTTTIKNIEVDAQACKRGKQQNNKQKRTITMQTIMLYVVNVKTLSYGAQEMLCKQIGQASQDFFVTE